jgi:diguanylate cyclase
MDAFLQQGQAWYTQIEQTEEQLRKRLLELEKESKELRHRMLEAHHLALLDIVTELPNRLAYEERVQQEYARFKRFAAPLTLLVWDVDDFKAINDRYGHQAGDKALRVIGRSLKQRLRETDFIARYGGEEFVTLLCGADAKGAIKVAEQMRLNVMHCAFHSTGKAVRLTISCGLAEFAEGDTIDAVFARADKALYQAKHKGKNRCELA